MTSFFVSSTDAPGQLSEPAYWFIFQRDQMLVQPNGNGVNIPLVTTLGEIGVEPIRRQYLGHVQNGESEPIHCFSAEIDDAATVRDGLMVDGLRNLHPQLGATFFEIAGRAVQIVSWDRTHQFCGRCGAATETLSGERAKKCPRCGLTNFPRLSPAIIIAVVRQDEQGRRLLLARNHRFPAGRYSVIAGFVEPGETLEECAHREVMEEVGIRIKNVRYFASQPWPFPNSLMIGFTAEYAGGDFVLEEAEIAEAGWFAADEFPQLPPKISIARRLIDEFVAQETG